MVYTNLDLVLVCMYMLSVSTLPIARISLNLQLNSLCCGANWCYLLSNCLTCYLTSTCVYECMFIYIYTYLQFIVVLFAHCSLLSLLMNMHKYLFTANDKKLCSQVAGGS